MEKLDTVKVSDRVLVECVVTGTSTMSYDMTPVVDLAVIYKDDNMPYGSLNCKFTVYAKDVVPVKPKVDLHKAFLDYFHENEGYALKSERFYDDISPRMRGNLEQAVNCVNWLEDAFVAGAQSCLQ